MRDLGLIAVILAIVPVAILRPFVGVLLWCWVSFMNPHQLGWGIAAELPVATIAFIATLVGCVVAGEPKRLPVNAVTLSLLTLAGWITLTSFQALAQPAVVWAQWEIVSKIILGVILTCALLTDRRRIHALIWLMVIALGFFGVKGGLFTLVTGGGNIVLGPPSTIIGDRNHLAVALLVAVPLMNYLRLHSRHRGVRIALLASMALTLFAVVGSQSRGALLALVATGAVLWLRSRGKIVSGAAIVAAVAAAIAFMPASWTERMRTIENYQEDASATGRIAVWRTAVEIVRDRPLTGGGFRAVYDQTIVDRYTPGTQARADHSIWFEALGEHGVPGFLAWLGVILAGLACSLRITWLTRGREDLRWAYDLARMSQVSVVAYVVGGSLLSIAYWDMLWTLMATLAATLAIVRQSVRQEGRRAAPSSGRLPAMPWRGPGRIAGRAA